MSNTNTTKIIVVVHGIGDQIGYASAQSVAYQFCRYYEQPAAIPLGRFHTEFADDGKRSVPRPIFIKPPPSGLELPGLAFAEVYWADIPRTVVKEGYVLEEAKRWARTIVGRYRLYCLQLKDPVSSEEITRLETVLDEMIETIFVLEGLTWLPGWAGIFKYKLRKLLEDYLGDVQLVADFKTYREKILRQFDEVMCKALKLETSGQRELYLVAHSEGSVIAFLAILEAWNQPEKYSWVKSIRGLMTIGSPIETHHLLWPDLWQALRPSASVPRPLANERIRWWNYLDRGDPIAYRLDNTREWLDKTHEKGVHLWSDYFDFRTIKDPQETVFSRYYFPGKAHIDYWDDAELFGHFIQKVVGVPQPEYGLRLMSVAAADGLVNEGRKLVIVALVGTDLHIRIFDANGKKVVDKTENELVSGERLTALKKQLTPIPDESGLSKEHKQKIIEHATSIARHTQSAPRDFSRPPEDKSLAQVASRAVPYLLVLGLLFAAVFALYKPVVTELEVEPRAFNVLRDVGGLAVLLFGMTSAVRVPMLTKDRKWLVWSRLIFWAAIGAYPFVVHEGTQQGLGAFFVKYFHTIFGQYSHTLGLLWGLGVAVAVIAEICGWFARNHPKWGVRVLPLAGLVFAAVLVWWLFLSVPVRDDPELWPVLLGGVFAFYLWWLATLLFDLTVVWHHYVRARKASPTIWDLLRDQMPKAEKADDPIAPANG